MTSRHAVKGALSRVTFQLDPGIKKVIHLNRSKD